MSKPLYSLTPLHIAADLNRGETYYHQLEKLLADKNWTINAPSHRGDIALHILLKNGNSRIVGLFLKHGADVQFKDRRGRSAIMIAAKCNENADVMRLLLDSGANVGDVTQKNRTPLHRACIRVKFGIIKVLLDYGANVNAVDNLGRTPFLYLLFNGMIRKLGGKDFIISLRTLLLHNASNKITVNPFNNSVLSNPERFAKYTLNSVYIEYHTEAWKNILQFLARLTKMNVKNSRLIEIIESRKWLKKYYESCLCEIDKSKSVKVYGLISFYQLLTLSFNNLVDYVKNKKLLEEFKNSDYKTMFPVYSDIIKGRIDLALIKSANLDGAASFLTSCIPNTDASHIVIRKILSYLSTQDLKRLCDC